MHDAEVLVLLQDLLTLSSLARAWTTEHEDHLGTWGQALACLDNWLQCGRSRFESRGCELGQVLLDGGYHLQEHLVGRAA